MSDEFSDMTPSRPYLLRAIYQWIVDNDMTPHLVVNAALDGVQVPQQYVSNGKVVLNIAPQAVHGFNCSNDLIEFDARFNGQPMRISVPMAAALALYARENGCGMVFTDEVRTSPEPSSKKPPRPQLKVVK